MVRKPTLRFVCQSCGAIAAAWSGRCNTCGEWNTLEEEVVVKNAVVSSGITAGPMQINSVKGHMAASSKRLSTGLKDVDLVLGGGIVAGSVILLSGQPGIGKSTLLLQIADAVSAQTKVLFVSGEESAHQVGLRATRLGVTSNELKLATSNSADEITAAIASNDFGLVIVDSIQTLVCADVGSAAGSISQITNSTHLLSRAAKQTDTALVIVGHVTKEGSIAGPKLLEHTVDVVLQLEGDSPQAGGFKLLRSLKNRYGSTNEVSILEMVSSGLRPVSNPSAALLAERQVSDGSIVLATLEGARPLLVEVQALVNKTSYGYPKRAASGIDINRINLLIAVLERRTSLKLADQDIYINIVGGLKITEPAADLAVAMAIASAARGFQLKRDAVVYGEVGLSGEVRHTPQAEKRLAEAAKMGFKCAIGPRWPSGNKPPALLESVTDLKSALNRFLEK